MIRRLVVALWLAGCAPGADERPSGPVDSDLDGILDPDELALGTDPEDPDSDADTYIDGHELLAHTDPLDPEDRIYRGYWPYHPDKDAMSDPGFDGEPLAVGDVFGRVAGAVDQFGEDVDLYDFVGSSEFVVIDASATWCGVCQETSEWLSGGADPHDYEMLFAPARALVDSGAVRWITFLTDNGTSDGTTPEDVQRWDERFPHPEIPVLTDPDGHVLRGLNLGTSYSGIDYGYWPSFVVLDGRTFEVLNRGYAWDAMDYIVANTPE